MKALRKRYCVSTRRGDATATPSADGADLPRGAAAAPLRLGESLRRTPTTPYTPSPRKRSPIEPHRSRDASPTAPFDAASSKLIKNKAYFKRYQVKYKRRREGKTDYRARKRLITQDKNKCGIALPARRAVLEPICDCLRPLRRSRGRQVHLHGDVEGATQIRPEERLKNFAAAYATGLLCARRLLQKVGLDELYEGNDDPDGEVVSTEAGKKSAASRSSMMTSGPSSACWMRASPPPQRPPRLRGPEAAPATAASTSPTTTSARRLRQGGQGI